MRPIAAALSAAMLFGCSDQKQTPNATAQTPDAATASMPDVNAPAFNADSAFALLKRQVAFGPRVPGTAGHAAQLAWMQGYLAARADTVITQHIAHTGEHGQQIPMANVIARFNPGAAQRVLLITHWDTRPTADKDPVESNRSKPILGANDGASGVAVLMMLADMFRNQPPPIGVDLLFTDGEDWEQGDMYIGAKYFAANPLPDYRPLYGVLIDMIGDQNPVFPVEANSQSYAPEVVDRVWRAAEHLGLSAVFPRRMGMAVGDDHDAINAGGIRTIDIIDGEYGAPIPGTFGQYWHTLSDTVEQTSPKGLDAVGRVLAYLVYAGG
jgi:Zn-dependent M28 family amino/carboxypeptidase